MFQKDRTAITAFTEEFKNELQALERYPKEQRSTWPPGDRMEKILAKYEQNSDMLLQHARVIALVFREKLKLEEAAATKEAGAPGEAAAENDGAPGEAATKRIAQNLLWALHLLSTKAEKGCTRCGAAYKNVCKLALEPLNKHFPKPERDKWCLDEAYVEKLLNMDDSELCQYTSITANVFVATIEQEKSAAFAEDVGAPAEGAPTEGALPQGARVAETPLLMGSAPRR